MVETQDCYFSYDINPLYQEKVEQKKQINLFSLEIIASIIAGLIILYIFTKR